MDRNKYSPLPGYQKYYEINEQGDIRSLDRTIIKYNKWGGLTTCVINGKPLKWALCCGYPVVSIGYNNSFQKLRVSRLVAITFVPNPNNYPFVLHNDDNPLNNHVSNLSWGTHEMNMKQMDNRKRRKSGVSFGTKNGCHVLNNRKVRAIRKKHSLGSTIAALARANKCSESTISRVVKNKLWKEV